MKSVQKNTLGSIGSLTALGGTITGQPWLTALGMGMQGVGNAINGGGRGGSGSSIGNLMNGILCGGWYNPADGNIASENPNADLFTKLMTLRQGGFI